MGIYLNPPADAFEAILREKNICRQIRANRRHQQCTQQQPHAHLFQQTTSLWKILCCQNARRILLKGC